MSDSAYITGDEILERRERELLAQAQSIGEQICVLQGFWQKLKPGRNKRLASQKLRLLKVISALDEVREVRRLLLGLAPQAHIRKRDIPNFVAQNPAYASVVACEHEAEGQTI
ncbi:MAG: hypothetical protein ACI376_02955 [Candidatus Bruticola sp.]